MSAAARPFLFERSFDPPTASGTGPRTLTAQDATDVMPRLYSEEDLARAREDAAANARAAALHEAAQANDQHLANALAHIADTLDEQTQIARKALATAARDGISVSVALIRKLLPEACRRAAPLEIEGLLSEVLADVVGEPELILNVHPTLADTLNVRVAEIAESKGFTGDVTVRADTSIAPGDAAVHWPAGDAVRSLETLWQRLEEALARTIASLEPAADTSHTPHAQQETPSRESVALPAPPTDAYGDHHGRE